MVEYSKRLGVITDAQLQAALERFGLGDLVQAAPIPYGLFGQNLFLTSSVGEFVLRGNNHYYWQFPAERFFVEQLHEHTTVPVPWPYLLDTNTDIFGWSYVIMPRLSGMQLTSRETEQKLTGADKMAIAWAMGENLANMQALTWPYAGRYDLASDTIQPFAEGYAQWLIANIRHNLSLARQHSARTTAADVSWVEHLIAQGRPALEADYQPCFVMEDYNENNVVVALKDNRWQVSGVFDFMTSYFADGEADLSRIVAMYLERDAALAVEFVRAYLKTRPARPGFAARFPLHMLNDRLIVWEYFQRPSHPMDEDYTLQQWASRYVSFIDNYQL